MFSLICTWINDWVNNRAADELRRHRGHYGVIVMMRPDEKGVSWWRHQMQTFSTLLAMAAFYSRSLRPARFFISSILSTVLKQLILLQACQNKHFWSLTYLFITIHYVSSEDLGIRCLTWSSLNSGGGNCKKAKIRHSHSWTPICHRFTLCASNCMFLGVGNLKNWWKIAYSARKVAISKISYFRSGL